MLTILILCIIFSTAIPPRQLFSKTECVLIVKFSQAYIAMGDDQSIVESCLHVVLNVFSVIHLFSRPSKSSRGGCYDLLFIISCICDNKTRFSAASPSTMTLSFLFFIILYLIHPNFI